jgi:hypothetical protein
LDWPTIQRALLEESAKERRQGRTRCCCEREDIASNMRATPHMRQKAHVHTDLIHITFSDYPRA